MPYYTRLADVARRAGYPVVEVPGWKSRGHGPMKGVKTVVAHHTAGPARGNYPSLNVVAYGRSGLPGPLSHYGIGRDGTVFVIAAGMSYHTGQTRTPSESNSYAIGLEVENTGLGEPWPARQMDAYVKLCAELVKEFGLSSTDVKGHKEIAVPKGRKPDPAGIDMDTFRAAVKRGYWSSSIKTAATSVVKNSGSALIGDKTTIWPEKELPLTDSHSTDSHNAWVTLLEDVGYKGGSLGLSLQTWLRDLGHYPGILDGDFGKLSIMALQKFLEDKGVYNGIVDGKRGPATVRAEIKYLNDQRLFYDEAEKPASKPTVSKPAPQKETTTLSKQIVTEAFDDYLVPYFDHSIGEVKYIPFKKALHYISLGISKARTENAAYYAGLETAIKTLADNQGLDGEAILVAVREETARVVKEALPAEVTIALGE